MKLLTRWISTIYSRYQRRVIRKTKAQLGSCGFSVELAADGRYQNPENIRIENYVYFGSGAQLFARGGISIGSNVVIGPNLTIHTSNHNYDSERMLPFDDVSFLEPVSIGNNVWIGANVSICPGVSIGEGCVIGMGSVVSADLPSLAIAAGNPARVIRTRNEKRYLELKQSNSLYLPLKQQGKTRTLFVQRQ